jgi:hypothetical protein
MIKAAISRPLIGWKPKYPSSAKFSLLVEFVIYDFYINKTNINPHDCNNVFAYCYKQACVHLTDMQLFLSVSVTAHTARRQKQVPMNIALFAGIRKMFKIQYSIKAKKMNKRAFHQHKGHIRSILYEWYSTLLHCT